ncbi:MAG: PQQ-binding-like beta-propeller repeat protein, partial [Limisphaerales bacterium]
GEVVAAADLSRPNAFAAGHVWPAWHGVDAGVRGPGDAPLVESFQRARPLWRSEAALPVCFGSAADFRYALRAAAQGTCGGASSPVVADGRVFTVHYQPAGDVDESSFKQWVGKEADTYAKLPDYQQAWVRDMFRVSADDVVIAHDAATGRTLWRTTLPARDMNLQTHKHRGVNPTPLAADGALYVVNYRGRVARLDAATGQVSWEFPAAPKQPVIGKVGQASSGEVPVGCASPVRLGDVLGVTLKDELVALDAATGRVRWRTKVGTEAELRAWDGAFLAVGIERPKQKGQPDRTWVARVEATDGRVRWRAEVEFERDYRLPLLTGDLLVGYRFGAAAANNVTTGQANTLLAYRLGADGLQPAWRLTGLPAVVDSYGLAAHGGRAFLSGEKEIWAIALADGRVTARVAGTGGARTQVLWTAGDRLFLCPEGRHGSCWLTMLDTRDGGLRLLGAEEFKHLDWRGAWPVANSFTTAYSQHQLIHPVVAGRLFVRGGDGLYCYDLRQP